MPGTNDHQIAMFDGSDAIDAYFECITSCSLDDEGGDCVTRCVEVHLKDESQSH